jgi:hypothetical protein
MGKRVSEANNSLEKNKKNKKNKYKKEGKSLTFRQVMTREREVMIKLDNKATLQTSIKWDAAN